METMYLVDLERPWKLVREAACDVRSGPKTSWVEYKGRRFMLGRSAFFTDEVASRVRAEKLEKMVKDYGLKGKNPNVWAEAQRALDLTKVKY